MKNILFATDLSKDSQKAFGYAIQFAKQYRAEISLVSIYQRPSIYRYPYSEYTQQQEEIDMAAVANKMDRMYEAYEKECGISSEVSYKLIKEPSVFKGILQSIKSDKPDVLMLGTKGDNMGEGFIFGNVIKKLVRECPVPVLTIPPEAVFREISDVLFTTNYHEGDPMAIKELVHLLNPIKPAIDVAHVSVYVDAEKDLKGEEFWETVQKVVDYDKLKYKVLTGRKIVDRLNEYIINNKPNLMVMTYKERGIWYDLFHTDVIKRMGLKSSLPVLTFNEKCLSQLTENDISMARDERV